MNVIKEALIAVALTLLIVVTSVMIAFGAQPLVYILLYLSPEHPPAYISVWSQFNACEAKAVELRKHFEVQGVPKEFMCVREGVRDIVDSDYGPENLPDRKYNR